MKKYIELFLTFFRIGAFTFGGGYAMLPMIQKEIVDKKKWATEEEVLDYYAVGQCTPGVIAVNTATFIGQKLYGIPGAIVGTLGVIFPSLVIILVIAAFITSFKDNIYVNYALSGINVAVAALVLKAVINLIKKSVKGIFAILIFLISFILAVFTDISSVYMVLGAIAAGIIYSKLISKKEEDKK